MLLASFALAAPPLLPLTTEAAIGDQTARFTVAGTGGYLDGADAGVAGAAEVAFGGRVAVGARIEGGTARPEPLLGGEVRVGLLQGDGAELATAVRYKRDGFVAGTDEVEGLLALGGRAGAWRLVGNVVGGHAVAHPEGDVEGLLAATRSFGDHVRIGADSRGRLGYGSEGGEGEEDEEEAAREAAEGGARRGDVLAGALAGHDLGAFSAVVWIGAEVAFAREGGAAAGPAGRLGVQLAF